MPRQKAVDAGARTSGRRDTPASPASLDEYRRKRHFDRTSEPSGAAPRRTAVHHLEFVVQKHAASHLHFDFRLELDGVMKSWAVPKGPSLDPSVKRLAMQVEDHPIEYNEFEGTIPKGEYGGGTVMIWDRGTYGPDRSRLPAAAADETDETLLRAAYQRGDFKFVLAGERLRGSWVLVRTRRPDANPERPQWLLIKHRDAYATPDIDIVALAPTSVVSGRTMDEIGAGVRRRGRGAEVWHSNRGSPIATPRRKTVAASKRKKTTPRREPAASKRKPAAKSRRKTSRRSTSDDGAPAHAPATAAAVVDLPRLPFALTNLDKVFFAEARYTKGDLVRYYAAVAPQILPVMRDRPLALKRYPNGAGQSFFFQQKAPDQLPPGVRAEPVRIATGAVSPRLIGGTLATLLYTVQLGCIEVDPWHARIQSLDAPDYAVLDLDPGPRVPFSRIVEIALWIKEALDALGLDGAAKTTGSRGIHIFIRLPRRSTDADAVRLTEGIARAIAAAHPRETTVEREIGRRKPDAVYLDYLQNARGKTIAAAYCVRPVPDARVSTPLRWSELTPSLDQHAFTIATVPARIAEIGDIWPW